MEKAVNAGFLVSLFLVIGCAHVPFAGKSSQPPTAAVKNGVHEGRPFESSGFVEKGRIVDGQRLQSGRNVVVIPFKAGVGVEATEALDKIALMIVKGISDAFASEGGGHHLQLLTVEDSQKADMIIQGHVTAMEHPSKIGRWILFKDTKKLGVEGKMTDAQTGEVILSFSDHAVSGAQREDHTQLGYRIGKNIGRFISAGME